MKIGYIRISTADQNTARQELLMEQLGVDEVYIDRMSGKNTNRPELKKMMEYVRRGDTVIVESISRFARNTRDLLELVEKLSAKGVEFVSKKEAIDTTIPTGKFMLTVFGAAAELEREYIFSNVSGRASPLPRIMAFTKGVSSFNRRNLRKSWLSGGVGKSPLPRPCGGWG